jgi:cell division protein ZapA
MATVTVEINGRPHQVGCAEGQEKRVTALAQQFDQHVRQVAQDVGQVGDLRLFLMAGLLLADENADLKSAVKLEPTADDAAVVEALNQAAARIEKLAAGL